MYQDIYNCICQNTKKEDILFIMSNLQPNCCLKVNFQKVDQHAGGKWLIHDTKRRKDNQLQSLKLPCRISNWVGRYSMTRPLWREHVTSDIVGYRFYSQRYILTTGRVRKINIGILTQSVWVGIKVIRSYYLRKWKLFCYFMRKLKWDITICKTIFAQTSEPQQN